MVRRLDLARDPFTTPAYDRREHFTTFDSLDTLILERDPSFLDYLFFHNVLDKYCWLVKLHYADRNTVKRKRYRLDTLLQRFILVNNIRADKAAECISTNQCPGKLEFLLTKAWHNELVRSDPLHPDYLQAGVQLYGWDGPGTGGFAAWNVVQSYYAFFEFLSTLTTVVNPGIQISGHKAVIREFNNHVIGKARDRLLFYPFTLTSNTPPAYIPSHPKHCEFHYASYPREPGRSIADLEHELQKAFALDSGGKRRSIIDLFYELRLWANYTGTESLLRLNDGGYQAFLMRNLATLVFFAGGMAEIAVIFALGESAYLGLLKRFSLNYIQKNERFARNKYLVPSYVRLRAYQHLGLTRHPPGFIVPEPADPVQFIDV